MFTRDRITTPCPSRAPKTRSTATFSPDGTGNHGAKINERTTHQATSFQAGAPLEKPRLSNFDRSGMMKGEGRLT